MNTFGERLKNLRIEKHMTQKQLAKKLGITNMAVCYAVCYYERDKRNPSLEALRNICKCFNVSSDYLLGLKERK